MVGGDAREFRVVGAGDGLGPGKMRERGGVVFDFKFGEAEKAPRRSEIGRKLYQLLEGGDGFGVMIPVVLERAQVVPSLGPVRVKGKRLGVGVDGLVGLAGFARSGCRLGK